MADQNVRVTNLDHGSPTRVAYDLWYNLRYLLPSHQNAAQGIADELALFERCRSAAHGVRYDASKLS